MIKDNTSHYINQSEISSYLFDVRKYNALTRDQETELIKKIKAKSKNPKVGVIIGSPVFNQFPELVANLGADMIGLDAEDALEKATYYVERLR